MTPRLELCAKGGFGWQLASGQQAAAINFRRKSVADATPAFPPQGPFSRLQSFE
jgi:hypothetical protein